MPLASLLSIGKTEMPTLTDSSNAHVVDFADRRHRLDDLLGDLHRRGRRPEVGGEHGEFVAAEAADVVRLAQDRAQLARDLQQHVVAGLVTEDVVDLLEPVDVENQDGAGELGAPRLIKRVLQLLEEGAAIEQAGERVGLGEADQFVVACLPLHGVADGTKEHARLDVALLKIVARALFQRVGRGLHVGKAGEDDDRQVRVELGDLADAIEAVGIRQPEIEEDDVEMRLGPADGLAGLARACRAR